jgi:hypothetical protein
VGVDGVVRAHLLVITEELMDKEQRHTLAKIYDDPHAAGVRWRDVEQLFPGLGAYAKWSDPSHLTVELKGHKESFETPYRDKNAVLTESDGKKVRDFLESAGIGKDMAQG